MPRPKGKGTGRKQTIADKIARERRATSPEKDTSDEPSHMVVGEVFKFTAVDRRIIPVAISEYDKRCKTTRNNMLDVQTSVVDIDTIRSRNAIIADLVSKSQLNDTVTLTHPLRVTLGAALSVHMRWLRQEQDKVAGRVVDVDNIEKARDDVQNLANKLGEQLELYVQTTEEAAPVKSDQRDLLNTEDDD